MLCFYFLTMKFGFFSWCGYLFICFFIDGEFKDISYLEILVITVTFDIIFS